MKPTRLDIESITATGDNSLQMVVVQKATDPNNGAAWIIKSRARLDCELRAGDKYSWFEATRVEAVPVN